MENNTAVLERTRKASSTRLGYRIAKRAMDILLAGVGTVIAAPFILLIVLAIKLDSKGPAFYVHNRIGKNGKPLRLYKFRSMYINADQLFQQFTPEQKAEWQENFKLREDPRITRVGSFLRRSSLDELPQLLNILQGNLSVVGPRPVVAEELEKYGPNKERFLSVTPGLTGYWQAFTRSDGTYEDRMAMELYYVDHANLWWDIKIILATVGSVLKGRGAR
ncbi:MAG: sugar transferase [Ruminococcaceae bacterium]|nr:sugar transferase [Oscillospiraceae bacterium]